MDNKPPLDIATERRNASWRKELNKSIPNKDRLALTRQKMPELDAAYRSQTLTEEVNLGLTLEMAMEEARRCLDCPKPGCIEGCPVNIQIPSFIKEVERGDIHRAYEVLRETSSLPAVCGRVCPQEKQCESQCIYTLKLKKPAVAIGYLERFVADSALNIELTQEHQASHIEENNIKIAVVGSGPAGLSFAHDMRKYGYDVTVFEALHEIGGVLKYGIPEFRLPNRIIDQEIEQLKKIGVKFENNTIIGKTLSYHDLQEMGYRGMFVASGAGLPKFMNIPGENLIGVMSANEYLTRVNLMKAGRMGSDTPVLIGKHVAVVGGGNTAMDSARTAKRMGAERVMIVYRRSLEEMPAREEEVLHAQEEGIEFLTLHNPIEYISSGEDGRVSLMRLEKMELGEPDESGRRRPIPIKDLVVEIPVDEVIVSIGVSPNPLIPRSIPGLETSRWGTLVVNEENETSIPTIFAGGDIVRGGATVILAMGDGRKAALGLHKKLSEIAQ